MKYHIPARYMYVWSICTCKTEYTNTEMSTLSILVQNSMSYTIKFVVKSPWILNTSLIPTGIQGICFINFFVDFFIFHFSLLCTVWQNFPPFSVFSPSVVFISLLLLYLPVYTCTFLSFSKLYCLVYFIYQSILILILFSFSELLITCCVAWLITCLVSLFKLCMFLILYSILILFLFRSTSTH